MPLPKILQDNLAIPVIGSPLFLVSGPELVIAQCKAGIVGSFPALNARPQHVLEEWLIRIKEELAQAKAENPNLPIAPYAVNQICHASNDRLMGDMELCVKHEVPIIITSLGAVPQLVGAVHSYGGLVFHDVIKKRHAEKAAEAGVDGLILVSAGAGGHAGTLNPMPFVAEIKKFFKKTIILSGCISNGRDVASALQMGADFAYMGTRFINTKESKAPAEYRDMIMNSGASDVVYTAAISGVSANFLRPSLEAMGITEEMLKKSKKIDFGNELNAMEKEAKAWSTIWSAGQGVTNIQDNPSVKQLVEKMKEEFVVAIEEQYEALKIYE